MSSVRGIDTHLDQQRDISSGLVSALAAGSDLLQSVDVASVSATSSVCNASDGRVSESKAKFQVWELPDNSKPARAESWSNTINLQKEYVLLHYTVDLPCYCTRCVLNYFFATNTSTAHLSGHL